MTVARPQPDAPLLHLCADAAAAEIVRRSAARSRLSYRRFDDAFALALHLLGSVPPPGTILLLALDMMAAVEMDLPAWAAKRWPGLLILAHGAAGRLNGSSAHVRTIALADLDHAIRQDDTPPAARPPQQVPQTPPAPPAPDLTRDEEIDLRIDQALDEEVAPPPAPQPEPLAPTPPPLPASPDKGPVRLRLHAPSPRQNQGHLLTPEELTALLSGGGIDDDLG
ncbi:MAG: hypothetical protein BIFFINMI_02682 [Phycisphaerae bacterium]|nr:hypothetical protein [Phycisphaerae bacterium]